MPVIHFSPYWITTTIGLALFVLIWKSDRRKLTKLAAVENTECAPSPSVSSRAEEIIQRKEPPKAMQPKELHKAIVEDEFRGRDIEKYVGALVDGPIKFQRVDNIPYHGRPDKMQVVLDVDRPEDEPKRVYPWAFSCVVPDDKEHEVLHRLMPGTPLRITGTVEGVGMGIRIANANLSPL